MTEINFPWEPIISNAYRHYSVEFYDLDDRDIGTATTHVYLLYTAHTTVFGSWEPDHNPTHPAVIEQWARDMYLRPSDAPDYIDTGGADHNIFIRTIKWDGTFENTTTPPRGEAINDKLKIMTNGGYEDFYRVNSNIVALHNKNSGWSDNVQWSGNTYAAKPFGAAHMVPINLKMFGNEHISWWLCYIEVPYDVYLGWQQPQYDSFADMMYNEAEKELLIPVNISAALPKKAWADGYFIATSLEFDREWEGIPYRAQRFQNPDSGETRVYYAEMDKWGTVLWVPGKNAPT